MTPPADPILAEPIRKLRELGNAWNRGEFVPNLAEQIWDQCDALGKLADRLRVGVPPALQEQSNEPETLPEVQEDVVPDERAMHEREVSGRKVAITHSLTLEFGRILSEAEWREIVPLARMLPHVQHLRADATQASLPPVRGPEGWQPIDRIIQRVAELPDRTSPDDWPEAMLVTGDELKHILEEELPDLPRDASPERRPDD